MSSLGLQHADEVKIVRLGGWPPVYEIVPTGKFDPTMRDSGKQIAERFVTAARGETGLQTLVDAVLETAGCAMSVCEISDALALCSCRPGYRVLREHLRKYTYYRRVADGRYLICVGRRRQYQLRIADLEDRVRSIKQDLRKAETMVLALRSENAKLKTENRGFRQRVSGLELERLRITESLSLSSTNVERLNQQLREAERRVQDLDERLRQSEHLADELMLHNRRLQTELRRPVWRVVLDSIIKLFGGASTGGSLSA